MERGTPFGGDVAHVHHGLWVVGIHVEDGRVDDARHVGTVGRGARVARIRRETDLIVGNDVDGAAGGVVGQVRQVERLVHDALTGKGGVAVQQNGHGL